MILKSTIQKTTLKCFGFIVVFFGSLSFAGQNMDSYLKATKFIDTENRSVVETARLLTEHFSDQKSKAVAIHNFVRDEVPFGFSTSFWKQTASQVIDEKKGFCNTKTTLFITLLRAVKIPARQKFVIINSKILDGFLDTGSSYVDHSYAEVFLEGKWVKTDSYILDSKLFNASQLELLKSDRVIGLGTVRGASNVWDGSADSFSQYLGPAKETVEMLTFAEYEDVGDFYLREKRAVNGSWLNRFIFNLIAGGTNQKIQKIRSTQQHKSSDS